MFDFPVPSVDFSLIAPVVLVAFGGIVALIVLMFRPRHCNNALATISVASLLGAVLVLCGQFFAPNAETFGDLVRRDTLSTALQILLAGTGMLVVLFSESYLRQKRIAYHEFYPLVLWSTAGGMIMVSTEHLLMLFLGLEVLSISLYVLAGLHRGNAKSEESALKYFLLGAFATSFLLFGMAFVYGASGSLHLSGIGEAWATSESTMQTLVVFGLLMMLVGLGFKAALVPFHEWTPDVYQGAPTNVTAFMAAASKVAAVGALYRVLDAAIPMRETWLPALFWMCVATMTFANLAALVQRDLKRVLGYSSIANAGYLLVAILAHVRMPEAIGAGTVVLYLAAYGSATLGAFAVISLMARDGREPTKFSDLNGLWTRSPLAALLLVIFVASLIGIPPTAGFFGKLFIFQDAVRAGLTSLAVLLALNSAVSAFYYLGIINAAYVSDPDASAVRPAPIRFGYRTVLLACCGIVFALSLVAAPLMNWVDGGATETVVLAQPAPGAD